VDVRDFISASHQFKERDKKKTKIILKKKAPTTWVIYSPKYLIPRATFSQSMSPLP